MFRLHVINAIFWRNFKQYFTSVLGYLFIFVFVTICALLTFSQQFFADNLVSLDQLSRFFPALLLFFVPAITMTVWADEKKQGTDAILFTLPASDLEILIGKFNAVVAVYSVALFFSVTTLGVLQWLGSPDWGVIAATYFGYWLAGVALASIGMFASSLTQSNTIAFLVGAILCAIPVLIGYLMQDNPVFALYGLAGQLRDFTLGMVTLPSITYFVSIIVFMLYLNLVVISKRHWSRGRQVTLSSQFALRIIALAIGIFSINVLADRSSAAFNNRIDLTSESLFTLDQTTRTTISQASDNGRPITIQAFLSPDMPRKYVNTRKNLIGLLRQYDRLGGSNVDVRFVNVEPNSKKVEEALSLGLQKRASRDTVAGRMVEQDVFMGVVITSTFDEVVLPFIDTDTSIEYQLTRSVATATAELDRLTIGILKTDAHFDNLKVQGREYNWVAPLTMAELRKQYSVSSVSPDDLPGLLALHPSSPNDETSVDDDDKKLPDVLIVADPSSLSNSGMFNLIAYIQKGNPVLILADPLPFYWAIYQAPTDLGLINAPAQPRIDERGGWQPLVATQGPKAAGGTALPLMQSLGIEWKYDTTIWSVFNPHAGFKPVLPQQFGERWIPEYGPKQNLFVFVKSHGGHQAFNTESPISSGLHELMFIYPGSVNAQKDATTRFEPLVSLKPGSAGHLGWDELTEDYVSTRLEINQFTGESKKITGPEISRYTGHNIRTIRKRPALNRPELTGGAGSVSDIRKVLDVKSHVLAAHIHGQGDDKTNVVFIADVDFISDMYFQQKDAIDTALDNFTFFVNAIETLAGDESFVRLRNRRQTPRTLSTIERLKEPFKLRAVEERDKAESEVDKKLADAEKRAADKAKRLNEDTEISRRERQSQLIFNELNEGMRLNKEDARIQRNLEKRIAAIEGEEKRSSQRVESRVRFLTIFSAGLPALLLGSFVLLFRTMREQNQIDPDRRVNKQEPQSNE